MDKWKKELRKEFPKPKKKLSYSERERVLRLLKYTKRRNGVWTKGKDNVVTLKNRDSIHKFQDLHIHTTAKIDIDQHQWGLFDEDFRSIIKDRAA